MRHRAGEYQPTMTRCQSRRRPGCTILYVVARAASDTAAAAAAVGDKSRLSHEAARHAESRRQRCVVTVINWRRLSAELS